MRLSDEFKKPFLIASSSIKGIPLINFKRFIDNQLSRFGLYKESNKWCTQYLLQTLEHFKLRYQSAFFQ
jgi:hypothetical protein